MCASRIFHSLARYVLQEKQYGVCSCLYEYDYVKIVSLAKQKISFLQMQMKCQIAM